MPELPEVQTVVNTLAPRILGQVIHSIPHLRPDILTPPTTELRSHLLGKTVTTLHRRGKRIIFHLDDGNCFYIHLGMTGRLTLESPDSPVQPHTHLILNLNPEPRTLNPLQLRFRDPRRFGGIWWLGQHPPDENMGPEPLTLRPAQLQKLLARTTRPIKSALLDQRLVAGLGNIYADESLFAARIHPLTKSNKLSPTQIKNLTRAIKSTLKKALRHRGSTLRDYVDANGQRGSYHLHHRVYDRAGQQCRTCETPIRRIVLTGRSTCFCPQCQPRRSSASRR